MHVHAQLITPIQLHIMWLYCVHNSLYSKMTKTQFYNIIMQWQTGQLTIDNIIYLKR